jgi:ubiquinone/menaquinone biosynthesis C-methylase UbiE
MESIDMNNAAKFWDRSATRYSKAPVRNEEAYQKKLEITRSYFTPESEVFEFACGTGSTAIAHSPFVKHILAIDISSRMLEIAQGKADERNISNITFRKSTLEEIEENREEIDVAMAHSILHLIENPEEASRKIFNMLKPEGIFVSSTFCLGDSNPIWRFVLPLARLIRLVPYVNILKRLELEKIITNSGFEIEHQSEHHKKEAAFIVAKKPKR